MKIRDAIIRKIAPFVENIAEATTACLVTMVQGNLLALTLSHWLIASQTGVAAGVVASAVILVSRASTRWIISATLGIATAVVDFLVHPAQFGPIAPVMDMVFFPVFFSAAIAFRRRRKFITD